jgi:hypothetical protein
VWGHLFGSHTSSEPDSNHSTKAKSPGPEGSSTVQESCVGPIPRRQLLVSPLPEGAAPKQNLEHSGVSGPGNFRILIQMSARLLEMPPYSWSYVQKELVGSPKRNPGVQDLCYRAGSFQCCHQLSIHVRAAVSQGTTLASLVQPVLLC